MLQNTTPRAFRHLLLTASILGNSLVAKAQGNCEWQQGELRTYVQASWGDNTSEAGLLLSANSNFSSLYGANALTVGGNFTLSFTSASSVLTFLPASSSPSVLSASLTDPVSSPAGEFGGQVTALKLNVDYSDAGFIQASSSTAFGDLVIHDFSVEPAVNGMSVREMLDLANVILGGGSGPFGAATANAVVNLLNNAFLNGTPSQFAIDHLRKSWQQGDFETYRQVDWGDGSSEAGQLLEGNAPPSNFTTLYGGSGLTVGSVNTATFTSISSVITFLPSGGTVGVLSGSLSNPLSTSAGTFAGDVVALKLNVDLSDAGYITAVQPIPFGDLVINDFSAVPAVNGMTIRQFLDLANSILGGNAAPFGPAIADGITSQINNAFLNGTPSQFAQDHLSGPGCNACPVTNPYSITTAANTGTTLALEADDADGDALTFTVAQQGAHGTGYIEFGYVLSYDPNPGFAGTDFFVYSVTDGTCSAEDTVFVTVLCPPWQQGEMLTYHQENWGNSAGAAGLLLTAEFTQQYPNDFVLGTTYTATFYPATSLHLFLPSLGVAGTLNGNLLNPTTTSAGDLAGEIAALKLNIDFSDAGLLPGSVPLGDLVIHDYSLIPSLNGLSVRDFFTTANAVLGASSAAYTPGITSSVSRLINGAFLNGTPSQFALDHLSDPNCDATNDCPVTQALSVNVGWGATTTFFLGATDPDSPGELSYFITEEPAHGNVDSDGDGNVTYTPDAGYIGADFFVYTVTDAYCNVQDTVFIFVECPDMADLDLITYRHTEWGDAASAAGALLTANFNALYPDGLVLGSTNTLTLTSANAVFTLLPAVEPDGVLTTSVQDPATTSAGQFASELVGLRLNVDFSDAGILPGPILLGDLVIHDHPYVSAANGLSIREFLAIANDVLGGSSTTFTPDEAANMAQALSSVFTEGTPNYFTLYHLLVPCTDITPCVNATSWQQGDHITYAQYTWETDGAATLASNYNAAFNNNLVVGGTFTMNFTSPSSIAGYLPSVGSPAPLNGNLTNPQNTSSGELGGQVVALTLNVVYNDLDLMAGSQLIRFGDLVIHDLTPAPLVNGLSVREMLAKANNLLGGGTEAFGTGTALAIVNLLNSAFLNGTPSQFAIDHLHYLCDPIPTNNCPIASSSSITTEVGVAAEVELQATDADNDALVYTMHEAPAHGTVSITDSSATYTPTAGYYGDDLFVFNVSDGACEVQDTVYVSVVVCPEGHGYWKNNPGAWDASWTPMLLGTVSYTQQQLIQILNTPVGNGNNANASRILAKQLIAANLNILNGVVAPQSVLDAIAAANALIGASTIPMNVKVNTALGQQMVAVASLLDDFNSGELTDGCGGPKSLAVEDENVEGLMMEPIVPNPFSTMATIRYYLPEETAVSLTVYSALGQEVITLANAVQSGWQSVTLDGSALQSGAAHVRLQAGGVVFQEKLLLMK